jgi:hypothetical protein
MFAANTYRIRLATDEDTDALRGLAERNSRPPLEGSVLIGELDGVVVAALSRSEGRVIADWSAGVDHLVANLRLRAAREEVYQLGDRLDEGLEEMISDPKHLTQANMAEEIDRFVAALNANHILPEDF